MEPRCCKTRRFPHYMLKEIHEEPETIRKTVGAGARGGLPDFGAGNVDMAALDRAAHIHIVACGTAMHAGLIGKRVIERFSGIPVSVEIASEFRYSAPIVSENDLFIAISQSGETADTLAALRLAKSLGMYTLSIVNVVGSSVARESDGVIYTCAVRRSRSPAQRRISCSFPFYICWRRISVFAAASFPKGKCRRSFRI